MVPSSQIQLSLGLPVAASLAKRSSFKLYKFSTYSTGSRGYPLCLARPLGQRTDESKLDDVIGQAKRHSHCNHHQR